MSALPTPKLCQEPLPASPLGLWLCQTFGFHLWNTIEAPTPEPGQKPEWKTNKYKMTPRTLYRRWGDSTQVVGVRFGRETTYFVLDIDTKSPYHPNQDASAFKQIRLVLEMIGIYRVLIVRSSHSGGFHLYIPLEESVPSFGLALAVQQTLKAQGFEIRGGTLEVFPNVKPYAKPGQFSNYNALRLPLQPQTGSYLVDEDGAFVTDDLGQFLELWKTAARQQDVGELREAIAHARLSNKGQYRPGSAKVKDWEDDLKNEIEQGWTGPSQTNYLLGRIGCYGVVFLGLEGEALASYIEQTASQVPGYAQWCRHQQEIKLRATMWAKSAEAYYWPLGSNPRREGNVHRDGPKLGSLVEFNKLVSEQAQQRIKQAVAALEEQGQLPPEVGARAKAIAETAKAIAGKGVSTRTLYNKRHLSLWHPEHYDASQPVTNVMCKTLEPEPDSSVLTSCTSTELNCQNADDGELFYTSPYMKGLELENGSDLFPSFYSDRSPRRPLSTDFSTGSSPATASNPHKSIDSQACQDSDSILPNLAQPKQLTLSNLFDLSDIHVGIQIQVKRLCWNPDDLRAFVERNFGGRTKSWLGDDELVDLLARLRKLEGIWHFDAEPLEPSVERFNGS
jgi:hypothetical protein